MVPTVRRFDAWLCGSIVLVWLIAACTSLTAGPPRELEADDDAAPAAFANESDSPRRLTPRTKSSNVDTPPPTVSKRLATQTSLWGTVIGLAAVFGLFVAGKVWLTRHGPPGLRGLPVEALELLGKRTLEPRVSIHVVRCGPKILILGVGPDGVRTLTEIADPVEIDLLAGACRKKDAGRLNGESFAGLFRQSAPRQGGG